jgi:hypothetical protein
MLLSTARSILVVEMLVHQEKVARIAAIKFTIDYNGYNSFTVCVREFITGNWWVIFAVIPVKLTVIWMRYWCVFIL